MSDVEDLLVARKKKSNRTVPLTPATLELLEELEIERNSKCVFSYEHDERLSYEAIRYHTINACEEAEIEYRGEHVFRHTFATNCYHKGIDVKILSRLLGHADENITYNLYIHLYGDGFDELYSPLVSSSPSSD